MFICNLSSLISFKNSLERIKPLHVCVVPLIYFRSEEVYFLTKADVDWSNAVVQ